MKIAAVCVTYLRPKLLGEVVRSFELQDYPLEQRELVILDDAGQYRNQSGPGWRLISIPGRFHSLGEKRNAAVALASPDAEAFAVWDDDDVYLPWALGTVARALRRGTWARPSQVLLELPGGRLGRFATYPAGDPARRAYHGGWAYRRGVFQRVGGYRAINNGEDREFARRVFAEFGQSVDPADDHPDPYYLYRGNTGSYHTSSLKPGGYAGLGLRRVAKIDRLAIGWAKDYRTLPIEKRLRPRRW